MQIKCNLATRVKRRVPISILGSILAILVSVFGYRRDYNDSHGTYASPINLSKISNPYLLFHNLPRCDGICAANGNIMLPLDQSEAGIAAVINVAHASGANAILYMGGGGGDPLILQLSSAALSIQLVDSLSSYLTARNLDGTVANNGLLDRKIIIYYVGRPTMTRDTQLGKQYGDIMIWDLTQDAIIPHSLQN